MFDNILGGTLFVAGLLIIFCGAIYINDHVTCSTLGGLIKGACVIK